MAAVPDYKINYKSDFVLTINGDAGWTCPFCIKFWTGMPSQGYFVGYDGITYKNCRIGDEPTELVVMFDDHHLPIGKLKMQIASHTTIEEFPGSVFDEVTNARDVIVDIDGTDKQAVLDFTGETAPELEFNLPAYANEAERIQNELQRQQNEAARIEAELQREQATAAAVEGAENVNAQLNGTTLTVTNRNGVSRSVNTKGEQGEQGPVGPEGPQGETGISIVSFLPKSETATTLIYTITFSNGHTQDVSIPKGPKGDTGATGPTGPQGPQGDTGVSITGFIETGETETATLYNITFSNGTTQEVAIPKGEKGDQGPVGPQGPQGPMGDVAVITPEQQAAFTMYSVPGQNTDGPMTQAATTSALNSLAASGISYDNSISGLTAQNVQSALDETSAIIGIKDRNSLNYTDGYISPTGVITGSTAFQYSKPIYLFAGDTITVVTASYLFAPISLYNGGNYTPIYAPTSGDTTTLKTYIYTAVSDCNVVACVKKSPTPSVTIESNVIPLNKAKGIEYDNSQSGLGAKNVQAALDEMAESDTDLYSCNIWTTSSDNAIRNGSVGNGGNTTCVAVTKIIDVTNIKRVRLVTNRPNSTNCVYRWVYTTYSVTSGNSNIATNRVRIFDSYVSNDYPVEFGLQESEVGLAFGVLEWNTNTNTASALRATNFSGYVIGFEGVKRQPKYDYPVLQEGTSLTLDLFKMDVGSLQTSGVIASVYGGAFTTFPIELTGTATITVTKPTTTIGGTTIVPQLRIVEFDTVECVNGTMLYNATPTSNYTFTPTKKYVRIHLGWFDGQDMLTIKNAFGGLQISSTAKIRVLNIPTRQLPTFPFKDVTYIPSSSARVGSVGNLGNAYSVSTYYVIPTHGHKYAMLYTSYTPQDGCVLRFTSVGLTVDNGKSEVSSNVDTNRVFYVDYGYGNNIVSDVSDAVGIAFSAVEYNLSTGTYTGRDTLLAALNDKHFGVILFDEHTSITPYLDKNAILNASVTELNGTNNVKNLLAQTTRYPRVGQTQKTKPLTLLHFSDMHGSASALRRIIAFKNEWSSYIDDILDTGDTIYLRYSNDWTWFTSIEGSDDILMTIGNHDALAATSGWDWTNLITPQQGYERYMAGIANWGATYTANTTYYYKDYTTEKIRLIVLDCMLWDSTQLTWLTNTLTSAKTAGLAVVCVSHYPPSINGLDDCSFNSPNSNTIGDHISQDAVTAVDTFIQNQGEFITWVCGHTHWDKFGTVTDYPDQTVVVVDTCATDADNLAYSDVARVDGTKSQDLFNIISFDTWNKRVKLTRIGADYDFMMRHKGTLCWDYANQKLLWNT